MSSVEGGKNAMCFKTRRRRPLWDLGRPMTSTRISEIRHKNFKNHNQKHE